MKLSHFSLAVIDGNCLLTYLSVVFGGWDQVWLTLVTPALDKCPDHSKCSFNWRRLLSSLSARSQEARFYLALPGWVQGFEVRDPIGKIASKETFSSENVIFFWLRGSGYFIGATSSQNISKYPGNCSLPWLFLPFPNSHQVLLCVTGPQALLPVLHSTSHLPPLSPHIGLWHPCGITLLLSHQSAPSRMTREGLRFRISWPWTHSPWYSPWSLQSTSPILSHWRSDPLLLGKWPSGHMDSGKASLVAQRTLEASERRCGAEVGPESQETAGQETD